MQRAALPAPEIPRSIEDLTPEWLTAVLRADGRLAQGRVSGREVEILGEGEGFVGQVARLRLAYEGSASEAPASLIAKLPIRVDRNRQLGEALGAYEREIRFYTEIAEEVPIRKPSCYHAAMDPNPFAGREKEALEFLDRLPRWLVRVLIPVSLWLAARSQRRYVLLLEDLAPSRRLGDQVAGCSRAEAEAVLRAIARVHAAWWARPELLSMGWIAPVAILSRYVEVLYRKGRPAFFEGPGRERSDRFCELADWLSTGGTPLIERMAELPYTLVHGDYRLDNLFLAGEGSEARVTVFDWQGVCRGPGVLDVAYFISGNLQPELAAEHELDLVRAWHEELCAHGVRGYDFERCRRDYDLTLLFIAYRMIAGLHMLDFEHDRGDALIEGWLARLDPLLPTDYRSRVVAAT